MADKKHGFSKRLVYAHDYLDAALEAKKHFGVTDRHSTGLRDLDEYLFGGYGRQDNWEILVLHGPYGLGKSTIAVNFLAAPILAGTNVGIMALEDDPTTVVLRLGMALNDEKLVGNAIKSKHIRLLPEESLERNWTLDELLKEIEDWFTDPKNGVDIILLDHLQFAFDAADLQHERSEWAAQSVFMRNLNSLMKRVNKTIILVSQQNRAGDVAGSIGIPRGATKMIGIGRIKGESIKRTLRLDKTRNTPERDAVFVVELVNSRIYTSEDQPGEVKKL